MNLVIVGSAAGAIHQCIPQRKKLLDVDIIADYDSAVKYATRWGIKSEQETENGVILFTDKFPVEVELIEKREHTKRLLTTMKNSGVDEFATPEWLLFMKESHKYKKDSPHFFKTLRDIHYMRNTGVKLPKGSEDLLIERERLTYTNKLPKLDVKTGDFFKQEDGFYVYEHDDIHKIVALDTTPAYTKYMQEGKQVLTSRDKFFSVPERVRLLGGVEEAMVLTAERSLIPNNFIPDPDKMFIYALSKVCSSITGGYFREYCYDNWFKIVDIYNKECKGKWVANLQRAIDNNEIRLYNSQTSIY